MDDEKKDAVDETSEEVLAESSESDESCPKSNDASDAETTGDAAQDTGDAVSKQDAPDLEKAKTKKIIMIAVGCFVAVLVTIVGILSFVHDWSPATCTEPETCKYCQATRGKALGHKWQEATCTTPKKCSRCKETTGKPLGHDFSDWVVDEEPTCAKVGKKHKVCKRCGHEQVSTISKKEHTEGETKVLIEPTIGDDGESTIGTKEVICSVCGQRIRTEQYTLSAEEIAASYKSQCEWPSYEDVARNPDSWEGHKVGFRGEVIQVLESNGSYTLRVNVTQGNYYWSDTIMVSYTSTSSSRILEDDVLTFYGTMEGMYSYESVMGATITVPLMNAVYVE